MSAQPVLPPLNWGQRDPESETRFRRLAAARIAGVIAAHKHAHEIEIVLAIGEVCPCTARWQREIWIDEVRRLIAEIIPKVAGAGA